MIGSDSSPSLLATGAPDIDRGASHGTAPVLVPPAAVSNGIELAPAAHVNTLVVPGVPGWIAASESSHKGALLVGSWPGPQVQCNCYVLSGWQESNRTCWPADRWW